MAGHGRNADGLTGSQPRDALNVVRFPGDWFGPLGDLVPIGTGADTEQDEHDLYADDPDGVGADSFWGEDAQDVHRVDTSAPVASTGRPSLRLRLLFGGGVAAAAAAVAATVVLGSGTLLGSGAQVGKPGGVPHGSHVQSAAHLTLAAQLKAAGRRTGLARSADNDRERAETAAMVRHTAKRGLPASAGVLPHSNQAVTQADTEVAAYAGTGDVATPTGLVPPPPNAMQLNP
jgi:hypothetical protein